VLLALLNFAHAITFGLLNAGACPIILALIPVALSDVRFWG
jgi:hypothetical protein